MRLRIQKRLLVAIMCLSVIVTAMLPPMQVKAGKTMSRDQRKRITDIALTQTGVVTNEEILDYVSAKYEQIFINTLTSYQSYLINKGETEATITNYYDFMQACIDGTDGAEIARLLGQKFITPEILVKYVNEHKEDITANLDIYYAITGEKITEGVNISLSDELVDYIRELFNEYVDAEAEYVYVDTLSPDDVNIKWFTSKTTYDAYVELIKNTPHAFRFMFHQNVGELYFSTDEYNEYVASGVSVYYLENPFGLIKEFETLGSDGFQYNIMIRGMDWQAYKAKTHKNVAVSAVENIVNNIEGTSWDEEDLWFASSRLGQFIKGYAETWIFTNDGRKVKVFRDMEAFKAHTVGKEPYYITDVSDSYNTTDNSVTVSGDYITGSNYQYSHEVVQNQIDNSENVDNSVVNNIVNNTTTNIINSYNDSLVGGGGDNDEDGGGGFGGLLDGIGGLVSGITDFLGFIFGLLGDAISLITSLFNTIFEGLKALGSIFTGFTGLLGDLFGFIPSDLINFLVLSIEAAVAIAIWKQFKK